VPRAGLDRATVIAAASELADEIGFDGLTWAWSLDHPGRYAVGVRAPRPDDDEYQAVARETVQILFDVVAGFGLTDEYAIDAVRALRTVIHGFLGLESDGAFQMERAPSDSYRFVIDTLINGMLAQATR